MEDDELIIRVHKQKKKKTVKQTVLKNKKKMDKNNIREFNKINKKKRLKLIIITLLIVLSLIFLLSSNIFNIKEIEVEGNVVLSVDKIISLSKIGRGTNIFAINSIGSVAGIKEDAYIEKANIKRVLPNKIKIIVEERTAKYMLQFADSYVYINKQGYILEIGNNKLDVPILTGIDTDLADIRTGARVSIQDLKSMNVVNNIIEASNNNGIGSLITYIDISDEKNYKLILESEGKTVYLGDCSELNTRILYLKAIIEETDGKKGEIFLNVDLYTGKVYFREEV